jgi:polyphosphate kinase
MMPETRAPESPEVPPSSVQDLADPALYINRELSWLKFNERVLVEALDREQPLLERAKFVSIFASNLDEFFMIRVSGLRQQLQAGVVKTTPDGMTPGEQLEAIRAELVPALEQHADCWANDIRPRLAAEEIHLLGLEELDDDQRAFVRRYFRDDVFATLTPLAVDPGHPFPHISNLSMNLAILVRDGDGFERFARVKVPGFYPRLLEIPIPAGQDSPGHYFAWMEDVVAANLDMLFPGVEIVAAYPFRVTRDADQEIEEDEAGDLLTTIRENLRLRHFGSAVRLEITDVAPAALREVLEENLGLAPYQVYTAADRVGLTDVMELMRVERPDLKDRPFTPSVPRQLDAEADIFAVIARRDLALYQPYDSFAPVVNFVRAAAEDPNVLAIKQTLYRVGQDSPIVRALSRARDNGKQVAALVELKARFDEANNIVWARALEDAGVHVVYGVLGLKTHAKMCLVVRREPDGIKRYLHLSTGNYNATTAKVYTDIGYFTADREICSEAARLFNALTGYSRGNEYDHLLVAPGSMRREFLRRIDREIERHREHGDGYIALKMNSLVDGKCIQALYRASQAGVRVELQVRGICCLRPEVPGVSENIRVTSVVGRFLEHSRIYYFRNGGDGNDEILMGSADLMPRNLDSRVEILFPVRDEQLKVAIRDQILEVHLRDTANSQRLAADGAYSPLVAAPDGEPFDSQQWMIDRPKSWTAS